MKRQSALSILTGLGLLVLGGLAGCRDAAKVAPADWSIAATLPAPSPVWDARDEPALTEAERAAFARQESPAPMATPTPPPQPISDDEGMSQEDLERWVRKWSYLSFKDVAGDRIGRLLNRETDEEFNEVREGQVFEGIVTVAALSPGEICFVSGRSRACTGYQPPQVMVLLDEDLGPYSWPLAKPEIRDMMADSGNFAYVVQRPCYYMFRDEGGDFHPVEVGQGPDKYAFLNVSLNFSARGSDIVIGVCLDEEGKEWRRWGFESDPQLASDIAEEREGDTVGLPTGEWIAFALDLTRDLGLDPGTMMYGVQFLCRDRPVAVDYVNFSQQFQDATYPVSMD